MSDFGSSAAPRASTIERTFEVFLRLVAFGCLVAGLRYWGALIGLGGDAAARFDLMPLHWKIAASALAVLYPVAATGLWMTVSWGPVIWVVAAATEAAMFGAFPHLFGAHPMVLVVHGLVAVLYIALRLALAFERRRRAATFTKNSP